MRIGFDFDNTIVSYDALFHKVATEQGLIENSVPVNKLAVRDYLRAKGAENTWIEMQGYVYGARMQEAQFYPDVVESMVKMKKAGHTLAIISHKTKYPYRGEKYDLHLAARNWIEKNLHDNHHNLISHVFFELTKDDKLKRISDLECDVFIDDLPEILLASNFPKKTQRFLFDPEKSHTKLNLENINIVPNWLTFESFIL